MRSTVVSPSLVTNGSMAGDITSAVQNLNQIIVCAIQAVWTGSPVGTIKLQISNDNVNWTDYTGSSQDISAAGNFLWNLSDIGYQWVRVVYTRASGSGTLNISVSLKGI